MLGCILALAFTPGATRPPAAEVARIVLVPTPVPVPVPVPMAVPFAVTAPMPPALPPAIGAAEVTAARVDGGIRVAAAGLNPEELYALEIYADIPHASVACMEEYRHRVRPSDAGRVVFRLRPSEDCALSCDLERTPYRVDVVRTDNELIARSAPIPCGGD